MTETDCLLLALNEAQKGVGFCAPNPAVGTVIANKDKILVLGHHKGPGRPHAEVEALGRLANHPDRHDLTLYVTLEPCCHHGRTPPCTDAIIQSGIKRVVYAYQDPNPVVGGKGAKALRAAGIHVEQIQVPQINLFYAPYAYWHAQQRPWVKIKLAMTQDHVIAGPNGESLKITGPEADEKTHQERLHADALLTTAKTVLADNPKLNVRLDNKVISKPLYVLDRRLTLTGKEQVFNTGQSITLFHASDDGATIQALQDKGVTLIKVGAQDETLDLNDVLGKVGEAGVHLLWVEAGGKCFARFVEGGFAQEALIYVSPEKMAPGLSAPGVVQVLLNDQAHGDFTSLGKDRCYTIRLK